MDTKTIKISRDVIVSDEIDMVVEILRKNGVIVYPTETFYALGGNGFSKEAVRKIYLLKKRESQKPISVVISDLPMLYRIVSEVPAFAQKMIRDFWPGPLTLIFKASEEVPEEIRGRKGTIGVRLTGYSWVRALVHRADFPITATSANISGRREISDLRKAQELFGGVVDLIVDGGKTTGPLPSTVVDLSGRTPSLLREGAIPKARLSKYLPSLSEPTL